MILNKKITFLFILSLLLVSYPLETKAYWFWSSHQSSSQTTTGHQQHSSQASQAAPPHTASQSTPQAAHPIVDENGVPVTCAGYFCRVGKDMFSTLGFTVRTLRRAFHIARDRDPLNVTEHVAAIGNDCFEHGARVHRDIKFQISVFRQLFNYFKNLFKKKETPAQKQAREQREKQVRGQEEQRNRELRAQAAERRRAQAEEDQRKASSTAPQPE